MVAVEVAARSPARAARSPAGQVHLDALFRSQRHQPPGLHRWAGDQRHTPHLGQRRQHEDPFHPREPFAETLARSPTKGEIGVPGGTSLWWGCPPGRGERLWIGFFGESEKFRALAYPTRR